MNIELILFHVAWWISEARYDAVTAFLKATFGDFVLRERQLNKLRVEVSLYEFGKERIGANKIKLGSMFRQIEAQKAYLFIQDYSISQTSLEQIFNQFASQVYITLSTTSYTLNIDCALFVSLSLQQEEETGHAAGLRQTDYGDESVTVVQPHIKELQNSSTKNSPLDQSLTPL